MGTNLQKDLSIVDTTTGLRNRVRVHRDDELPGPGLGRRALDSIAGGRVELEYHPREVAMRSDAEIDDHVIEAPLEDLLGAKQTV